MIKIIVRVLGFLFLFAAAAYIPEFFIRGGISDDLSTITLRFFNVIIGIGLGYGLLRLKIWSLYFLAASILMLIIALLHNFFRADMPLNNLPLISGVFRAVMLVILWAHKDKLFGSRQDSAAI